MNITANKDGKEKTVTTFCAHHRLKNKIMIKVLASKSHPTLMGSLIILPFPNNTCTMSLHVLQVESCPEITFAKYLLFILKYLSINRKPYSFSNWVEKKIQNMNLCKVSVDIFFSKTNCNPLKMEIT